MDKINKIKLCLYPFSSEDLGLIDYLEDNDYVDLTDIITVNGLGLNNRDINECYNRKSYGRVVTTDIGQALILCDAILITNGSENDEKHVNSYEVMKKAIEYKKDVYCCFKLELDKKSTLEKLSNENNVVFKYLYDNPINGQYQKHVVSSFNSIETPVIAVGSLTERVDNFQVAIGITKQLEKSGYKVACVTNSSNGNFIGHYNYPDFFYNQSVSNKEKIKGLNRYFSYIEQKLKCDVIVIELPNSLGRYSEIVLDDFGINMHMFFLAANIDYFILNVAYDDFINNKYFDSISKSLYSKYNFNINYIHMSNKIINNFSPEYDEAIEYMFLPYQEIQENIDELNKTSRIPIYDLTDNEQLEIMYKDLESKF